MIMLYLVMLFVVLDLIRITGFLQLNRFMFNSWTGFIILTLIMVGFLLAGNINYHHKKRVELNIKTNKKIAIDKPLKIVAIADLHLGYGIGTEEFRSWVKLINQEEPDVLLIAGDAIDNSLKPLHEKNFAAIFREIKTIHGIYMVPGNHEYISNITKSIDFLTHAGVTILRDSVAMIDQVFYIVGRDDRSNSQRKTVDELTVALDSTKPIILLDHQPFNFDEVEKNQIDLFFAGHTHDGQAWPISLITKGMYEVSHGYLKKGNTHFYVTSGIGIWGGKFRIGSGSEYVVVRLD
jgi:predicted MPP superfamily phosphohydrolase